MITSPIRAILFDLDGVLIDTESMIAQVWADIFSSHGLYLSESEIISVTAGQTFEGVLSDLKNRYGWQAPAGFIQLLDERFSRSFDVVPELEGARETLEWLQEKNIPFAVASNSSATRLPLKLRGAGLYDLVKHAYSPAAVGGRGKPAPDLYLHAAAALGVLPSEALVIEDSVTGVLAGTAANMTVWGLVAASHSDHSGETLTKAGAHRIIASHTQLRANFAALFDL